MSRFDFTLQKTYFNQGFFNVGVEFERYFSNSDGPIMILVGPQKHSIAGRISRRYNTNHTPRIFGSVELRNWFQDNFETMDKLEGEIIDENTIWIKLSN